MKKKQRVYNRSFSIKIDPRNLNEFEGLVLDFKNHKVLGFRRNKTFPLIGDTLLQYSRDRQNGRKKVLHRSPAEKTEGWFNSNRQLLDYDHLIAVDTNTYHFEESCVSITAAYHLIPRFHDSNRAFCHAAVLGLVEMWNIRDKQENVGWWQVLQAIEKQPKDFTGTIGLIVDSDLGNHDKFNARELPIVGDFYLPSKVKLIYASDKGGPEHLSTKLIKYCHDLSADLYKEENLIMNIKDLHPCVGYPYSNIRQWGPESRKLRKFAALY